MQRFGDDNVIPYIQLMQRTKSAEKVFAIGPMNFEYTLPDNTERLALK